jgi:hypothetical protein
MGKRSTHAAKVYQTIALRRLMDEILALPPTPRIAGAPLFVNRLGEPSQRENETAPARFGNQRTMHYTQTPC